ncbi:hypothetical protein EYF80_050680 [Liparis tanakae]|uniref:Uncharacterized protein n=1 Tax=Liparis tanakae TaxID=230148 RepID=A0A4Z2FDU5_9TELE|nr:hypothetical protein EYF80_050680 [Liparis tanakae]
MALFFLPLELLTVGLSQRLAQRRLQLAARLSLLSQVLFCVFLALLEEQEGLGQVDLQLPMALPLLLKGLLQLLYSKLHLTSQNGVLFGEELAGALVYLLFNGLDGFWGRSGDGSCFALSTNTGSFALGSSPLGSSPSHDSLPFSRELSGRWAPGRRTEACTPRRCLERRSETIGVRASDRINRTKERRRPPPSSSSLTVAVRAPGDLPQHQPEGPDVHSLVGVEAVRLDALVQHLRRHVALGADLRVVAHVQQVVRLGVGHGQP